MLVCSSQPYLIFLGNFANFSTSVACDCSLKPVIPEEQNSVRRNFLSSFNSNLLRGNDEFTEGLFDLFSKYCRGMQTKKLFRKN